MESMMATVVTAVTTMTAVSAASEGLRGGLIGGQESQGQGHGGNCREGEFAGHGCFLFLADIGDGSRACLVFRSPVFLNNLPSEGLRDLLRTNWPFAATIAIFGRTRLDWGTLPHLDCRISDQESP
jgi:hypothetical protein